MRFALIPLLAAPLLAQAPSRQQALDAMKKAAAFYSGRVATEGGYHFHYAEDLSYGRSEHAEGATQTENQREATPRAAMAFLEAYEATRDRTFLDAAVKAAHNIVRGQLCSGGWDYVIEFDPALRKKYPYRVDSNCSGAASKPPTTLDDNVTQAVVRVLMRVDHALDFRDAAIHGAARFALDKLIEAQYPNGAWPQRFSEPPDPKKYPVKKASYPDSWAWKWPGAAYYDHYTFNDNSIVDCIDMMLEAARIYKEPRYQQSAEKGGAFILLAQMPDPQPAWAQQYDLDMHPAWARQFEPPSVTGGESQGIIKMLMVLYRETGQRKYLDAAKPALAWLEKSILPPSNSEARRRQRGEQALARFYELKTNKPLYVTKGNMIQAKGLGSVRPDGYELSYSDESVITHYGVVTGGGALPAIRKEFDQLAASAKPERRPERLHNLSPWSSPASPLTRRVNGDRAAKIIASLDERGAWLQDGVIGKSDRIVSVFAARAMVLTINGKPTEIKENDRIELFQGSQPPRVHIISTNTFADNLEALAAYVAGMK